MDAAIKLFEQLVSNLKRDEDVEWVFKSYKQLAKVTFFQQRYAETLRYIAHLIAMLPKLNGNYAEDSINKLLLRYMTCPNRAFVSEMYDVIVNKLLAFLVSGVSGHRLWLRINLNRFDNLLEDNDLGPARSLLKVIKDQLEKISELTRNSFLLDVIAAEIELSMRTGADIAELSQFHRRSLQAASTITHPRVMGIIRECGATVYFYRGQFEKARLEFYESFKNYDEAGSSTKKKILKYLSLCSMLTDSEVNPFESQETQSYAQLPEYQNLISLISAYESRDLDEYYSVISNMTATNDTLIQDIIFQVAEKHVRHDLKLKVLTNYLRASKAVTYDYLIKRLGFKNDEDLESLLLVMANSGLVSDVTINYVERHIEVGVVELKSLFPPNLDGESVEKNLRLLYNLEYSDIGKSRPESADDARMEIDSEISAVNQGSASVAPLRVSDRRNVYELLFCDSPQAKNNTNHEEWYTYMAAAIPNKKKPHADRQLRLPAKHLVNAGKAFQDDYENEGVVNTNAGLLGSAINHHEEHEIQNEEPMCAKIDVLMKFANSLRNSLKNLIGAL